MQSDRINSLKESFLSDLNSIAADLINLYGLEFKQEIENLKDPLSRWIDFRLRYIDPSPRKMFLSNKFPMALPDAVANGLDILERDILEGKDINRFQSKGLIRFNDHSGKKRSKRTDLLWADWGITHLHISDKLVPAGEFFSERTCSNGESWLLFCFFTETEAAFVDVRKHKDSHLFSDPDLLRTVYESWPEYMEKFKLSGVMSNHQYTNEEIGCLRKNGINPPLSINGEMFMGPGLGITSAATPVRVTGSISNMYNWIDWVASLCVDPDAQFHKEIEKFGVSEPDFHLRVTPQGLVVYEGKSNVAFNFPKYYSDANSMYNNKIQSLICPEWALQRINRARLD